MATSMSRDGETLPRGWPRRVRSGILHAISLARLTLTATHASAARGASARVRLAVENERLHQEIGLLQEELRLKDARMARVTALHRSHYQPMERLAILELRAARGWSLTQTAHRMLLTTATVSSWMRRRDEQGAKAILRSQQAVNAYPEFVRYLVQRLKILCPSLGYLKIAQMLCRAGLHLSATTIRRMIHSRVAPPEGTPAAPRAKRKAVFARYPNHLWHCDLTAVPIVSGLWAPGFPFSLPQRWPFCWWVAVVIDHFSRRLLGTACFYRTPSSKAMRGFLERAARRAGSWPRHLITDHGSQFTAKAFRRWCRARGVRQRFGAIDTHGGLAVIERVNRTLKDECTRRLILVPLSLAALQRELALYLGWYNAHRPHASLAVRTPDEVYFRKRPACRAPRFEPRPRWPRKSRCAAPQVLIRGRPGVVLELDVRFASGRRHLPLLTLKRVA